MKKIAVITLLLFILASCTPGQLFSPTFTPTQISTPSPIFTSTSSPTLTETLTPTPTLVLPVGLHTPVPESFGLITSENLHELQEIGRFYGNLYIAKLSRDLSRLIIRDTLGVSIYDYKSKRLLYHIDVGPHDDDPFDGRLSLQFSEDVEWVVVDGYWLYHPAAADLRVISDHEGLIPDPRFQQIAISPDGKNVAIYQDDETIKFNILDLKTDEFVYVWEGGYTSMHGYSPVFSPDGTLLSTVVDNQMILWNIEGQTKVQTYNLSSYPQDSVFSGDQSLIAVPAEDIVIIWSVLNGEKVQSFQIGNNCWKSKFGWESAPIFNSKTNTIALFDCEGKISIWSITSGQSLIEYQYQVDVPFVYIDDEGNLKEISVPENRVIQTPRFGIEIFRFLDNQTIALGFDATHCVLLLQSGNETCLENYILGTDNNYYRYHIVGSTIQIDKPLTTTIPEILYEIPLPGTYSSIIAFSPQSGLLISEDVLGRSGTHYQIRVLDLASNNVISIWDNFFNSSFVYSDDNKFGAFSLWFPGSAASERLVLVDLQEKTIVKEIFIPDAVTPPLAISHSGVDGRLAYQLITSEGNQHIVLVDLNNPLTRQIINIGENRMTILAFTPDDSSLVTYGTDGNIHFLDLTDGHELYSISGYREVEHVSFSPDGTKMAIFFGEGVISVFALPPFTPLDPLATQSYPPGMGTPISFDYPKDGQIVGLTGHFLFHVNEVKDAQLYQWSVYQNGKTLITTTTSDGYFSMLSEDPIHSQFVLGQVYISVRVKRFGVWSDPVYISFLLR